MISQDQALVLKIGGSLIEHAPMIIRIVRESGRDLLIIPGGGIFADIIRQKRISDTAAHFMAIAAMDQYGWFLSSCGMSVTREPIMTGEPTIFLPYDHLVRTDPLPHSWDITSDTISACYAGLLSLPLLILKSVDYIRDPGGEVSVLLPGMETRDLDPAFIPYITRHQVSGFILRGSDHARLAAFFRGEDVPGTSFGGTI
ncbi:uridylate kinase [Methanospirillum sp.]|uniref:uridylate kinase n=1 Tax=Methanospirillum sp. TaxID=45200 RepID=UPI00359FA527